MRDCSSIDVGYLWFKNININQVASRDKREMPLLTLCQLKLGKSIAASVLSITSSNQTFSSQFLHVSGQNWIWQEVRLGHRNRSQVDDSADLEASAIGLPAKNVTEINSDVSSKFMTGRSNWTEPRHSVCTLLPSYWEHCAACPRARFIT